ncbi:MAG: membrane protein insertase YidC [Spirochaetes bacterium]|nr:membrane protein insertase YidC [Spirochaetota bacterium]
MDKKTLFAVVLSVVIIVGSMIVQNIFFPAKSKTAALAPVSSALKTTEEKSKGTVPGKAVEEAAGTQGNIPAATGFVEPLKENLKEKEIIVNTDYFRIVFSNKGGVIRSLKFKRYRNTDGSSVEMVLSGKSGRYPFNIHFGNYNAEDDLNTIYHYKQLSESKWEFYKKYISPSGIPFVLRKIYSFPPHEYMMQLKIKIENSINEYPDLDFNGFAYSLEFGPQIGPHYNKLDGRNEYRRFIYYAGGKKKNVRVGKNSVHIQNKRVTWTAIIGKYFTVIAVPDATQYQIVYDTKSVAGIKDRDSLFLTRPVIKSSKSTDTYKFYIGPKKRDILSLYNNPEKNYYRISDLHFEEVVSASILIGWLANIFKFLLELFHRIVPNYGVGIILLTLLIKLVLFPLTHKSYESTSKMQALSPKMEELKAKYKGKPEQLNKAMAELYKKEGVNPLGGCLPMLLQLPVFFAFYSLLNNHFALRGAVFIPGWITDLSAPESIWNFAPFTIPMLGWHNLRLLPFIMLVSSFFQSKVSQAPGSSSGGQMGNMKMMTYAMPLIFFFILYDMPSGLLLYWTTQGILTVVQQLYINKIMKRKKDDNSGGTVSRKVKRRR